MIKNSVTYCSTTKKGCRILIKLRRMLKYSQLMVMLDVESTLYLEMTNHQLPGWIRGNTTNCLVLEVVTNYHQGKPGIEIRIDSSSGVNSQSWVRISNGHNKSVRG